MVYYGQLVGYDDDDNTVNDEGNDVDSIYDNTANDNDDDGWQDDDDDDDTANDDEVGVWAGGCLPRGRQQVSWGKTLVLLATLYLHHNIATQPYFYTTISQRNPISIPQYCNHISIHLENLFLYFWKPYIYTFCNYHDITCVPGVVNYDQQ